VSEHSDSIGGSSAGRAIACPASVRLARKYPNKSSEYAEEGTALHWCMEQLLENDDLLPESLEGCTAPNGITITADHVDEKLAPALEAFNKLCDELGITEFDIEARVAFTGNLEGCFGTTDVLGRGAAGTLVLDWKFGSGVMVSPIENQQAMFYAAAAAETPQVADLIDDEITIAIVQPPEAKTWRTTRARLEEFREQLEAAHRLSQEEQAPMAAGSHCRWCPAKPECPEHLEAARHAVVEPIVDENMTELSSTRT
jgi:hypothetical protein